MGVHCESAYARACPGCPALTERRFESLVHEGRGACAFRLATIEERAPLPQRLLRDYAFALVRHGVLVRTREDGEGATHAVDVVGPGGLALGATDDADRASGYAVGHLVLCLLPRLGAADALAGADGSVDDFVTLLDRARNRAERLAAVRARPRTTDRVSALLAMLSDTLAPSGPPLRRLPAALQQRDMAKLAGIRHESVCRAITTLERRRTIRRSADGLAILDRAALAEA